MAQNPPPFAGLSARLRRWRTRDSAAVGEPVAANISGMALVSHELRLPLAGMIGFAELLQASDLTEEQRGHARMIADSGRMLLGLIDGLQSHPAAGATQSGCDPRDVLRFSIKLLEPLARAKGLHLGLWIDPATPGVIGQDAQGLRQILLNLVGNAIRFTAQGGVEVEARVESTAAGRQFTINVIDSGIGIAADQLERIFRPFAQADDSIAMVYGGTGLGLAISQDIAARMGGQLAVHSQPGVGSNFALCLPLDVPCARTPEPAPLPPPPSANLLAGLRVLIAEDDGISRRLASALAASLGLEVELAGTGEQVIAAVAAAHRAGRPFGAVLMDVNLPGISGLETTRTLRALGHMPASLPVIALSADCRPALVSACHDAGMQAHIAKPVAALALARELARCLPDRTAKASPSDRLFPFETGKSLDERYLDRKRPLLASLRNALDLSPGAIDWASITSDLHRFAGVAAHFGEGGLGETARRLELRLRQTVDATERHLDLRQAWPLIAQVA